MITVETTIAAPLSKVWRYWTAPEYIKAWNFASDDWCCPAVINDLRPQGRFVWRMESKDGSTGFDFTGTYDRIEKERFISYTIEDGRRVEIVFHQRERAVSVTESFEPEGTNTDEMQRVGWQSILDNFKMLVESDDSTGNSIKL